MGVVKWVSRMNEFMSAGELRRLKGGSVFLLEKKRWFGG